MQLVPFVGVELVPETRQHVGFGPHSGATAILSAAVEPVGPMPPSCGEQFASRDAGALFHSVFDGVSHHEMVQTVYCW